MSFDWNSSSEFENGHQRSNVTPPPPYRRFLPLGKFNFFLSVTTITLERLNQSKPNFHTWLLTEIARPCTKMGIAAHMWFPRIGGFCPPLPLKFYIPPIWTNPNQIFTHDFWLEWLIQVRKWASHVKCNPPPNRGFLSLRKFNFFFFFFVCGHNNSWKAQPIRTKFLHMTCDWNSSS